MYYISHNYVIPQAMPHAIPQTHSAVYSHSLYISVMNIGKFLICIFLWIIFSLGMEKMQWARGLFLFLSKSSANRIDVTQVRQWFCYFVVFVKDKHNHELVPE